LLDFVNDFENIIGFVCVNETKFFEIYFFIVIVVEGTENSLEVIEA
jgi:hypothetical protein